MRLVSTWLPKDPNTWSRRTRAEGFWKACVMLKQATLFFKVISQSSVRKQALGPSVSRPRPTGEGPVPALEDFYSFHEVLSTGKTKVSTASDAMTKAEKVLTRWPWRASHQQWGISQLRLPAGQNTSSNTVMEEALLED